jgi:hypothetical protein
MAIFATGGIQNLPRNIADGIVAKTRTESVVSRLSGQTPQRFGNTDIITFNNIPKAEFVGEGVQKSSTTGDFGFVTATPKKAQVTMRFNQEVQWADEDYQLGILSTLGDAGATALADALDLGLLYRINPLTGSATTFPNYLNQTTNRVEITTATLPNPDLNIETAVGLVTAAGYPVTGMALAPSFGWTLSQARYTDGRKKFPELGFGTNITSFEGIPAAQGYTVSALNSDGSGTDNKVKAIVGDWSKGVVWGVQRNLPLSVIRFGDPDGQGDLQRQNQIALRLEIVYGWYVFTNRFAVVEDQTTNV